MICCLFLIDFQFLVFFCNVVSCAITALQVITEEQECLKLAIKEGLNEALKEIEQRRTGQEPLQKNVFESAVDGLKMDLELKMKTALQELKNGSDEKFIGAMDGFTETLNVFMETHKDMFSVNEEGGESDGTNTTEEGAEAEGTYNTKRVKSKFDLFLEKYNQDSLEVHRVLDKLVDKQADLVGDWYKEQAEKFLDETWMQRLRHAKAIFPHLAKIYFSYLFLKMMRQSSVPVWKYPAVARAGRVLMSQKVLEIFEEAEKKQGEKTGEDSKKLWLKVLEFFKNSKKPGEDEQTPEDEQKPGDD